MQKQKIDPAGLVPMNIFENIFKGEFPIKIDLVYAQSDHPDNKFPGLYSPDASILWAHKDIAKVTLLAAVMCHELYGWTLKLNDCLRPVEAQEAMAEYGFHTDLVSLPGTGAHPRAMAMDIEVLKNGQLVNMGTRFDHFVSDPDKAPNPADRSFIALGESFYDSANIHANRQKLEFVMRRAAEAFGIQIWPLPQEWWDFRMTTQRSDQFEPLHEADLLPFQRLINPDVNGIWQILEGHYPEEIRPVIQDVLDALEKFINVACERAPSGTSYTRQPCTTLNVKRVHQPR